jgi:hypothetical protein
MKHYEEYFIKFLIKISVSAPSTAWSSHIPKDGILAWESENPM